MITLSPKSTRPLLLATALLLAFANSAIASAKSEARSLYKQGKYGEALDKFRQAAHQEPNDAHLWWNLGFTYRKLKQYDKALTSFKKAAKIDPSHQFASAPGKYEEIMAATRRRLARHGKKGKAGSRAKPSEKRAAPAP